MRARHSILQAFLAGVGIFTSEVGLRRKPRLPVRHHRRNMCIQNIIIIGITMLVVTLANGCSKRESVAVSVSADRGTNVTAVTTNGYTVIVGKTTYGTNLNTNAPPGSKP